MKRICFAILLPLMLLTSCTEKSSDDVVSEGLITIPNVPNQWSYVSLTEGRVVGTCALTATVGTTHRLGPRYLQRYDTHQWRQFRPRIRSRRHDVGWL